MKLPVILSPEAESEYDNAFDFYENVRRGQGHQFAAAVNYVLDRTAANPLMHREVAPGSCTGSPPRLGKKLSLQRDLSTTAEPD